MSLSLSDKWIFLREAILSAGEKQYVEVVIFNPEKEEERVLHRAPAEAHRFWHTYPQICRERHPGSTMDDAIGYCLDLWAEILGNLSEETTEVAELPDPFEKTN